MRRRRRAPQDASRRRGLALAPWRVLGALALLAPFGPLGPLGSCGLAPAEGKGSLSKLEEEFEKAIKLVTPATVVCLPRDVEVPPNQAMLGSSGVVMSRKGLVLSDGDVGAHVVVGKDGKQELRHSDRVEVRIPNLRGKGFQGFSATVLQRNRDLDTSLLRLDRPPSTLTALDAGRSEDLRVGDFAFAMGNAFGLASEAPPTLTAGVIASLVPNTEAKGGRWRHIYVSAAVNPGVNGGPLVDARGRLIGTVSSAVSFGGKPPTDPELAYADLGKVVPVGRLRAFYADAAERAELFPDDGSAGPLPTESRALSTVFHQTARRAYGALVSLQVDRKDQLSLVEPGERALVIIPRYLGPVSGVLVGAEGWILTSLYNLANVATLVHGRRWAGAPDNARVQAGLDGIEKITVHLPDGRQAPARVAAHHEGLCLVLLKADLEAGATGGATGGATRASYRLLQPVTAADYAAGRFLLAVGHPFGAQRLEDPLLTVGVLSKEHAPDSQEPWSGQWQTDAGGTDANCGGAAVDVQGRLLGIMTIWSATLHGRNSGIGFVIPWTRIEPVLEQMKQGRSYRPPFMGVEWDLQGGTLEPVLARIVEGSPAATAGLQAGDRIRKIDGEEILSTDDVVRVLSRHWSGDRIVLRVQRAAAELELPLVLGWR